MSWRDALPIHPACKLFHPLPPDELRAVGEDIKAHGLREPITLWFPDSESNEPELLDGQNRMDAMEAVGISVVRDDWRGGGIHQLLVAWKGLYPPSDPHAYVLSANIHRRHQTAEERRQQTADVIKQTPGKSDRQIAKETGSNRTTVGQIRKTLEAAGDVSIIDTRTDTKGRRQPAKRSKSFAAHAHAVTERINAPPQEPVEVVPTPAEGITEFLRRQPATEPEPPMITADVLERNLQAEFEASNPTDDSKPPEAPAEQPPKPATNKTEADGVKRMREFHDRLRALFDEANLHTDTVIPQLSQRGRKALGKTLGNLRVDLLDLLDIVQRAERQRDRTTAEAAE